MKSIDRRLLQILVEVVWVRSAPKEALHPEWSRGMIKEAIEKRRREKYSKILKR